MGLPRVRQRQPEKQSQLPILWIGKTPPIVTFPHLIHSLATSENVKDIHALLSKDQPVVYQNFDRDGNQRWKLLPIRQKGIFVE